MRAVILAAGTGSRMGGLTRELPKAMLPLAGRPLLSWQAESLRRAGVDRLALVTGYLAERIELPAAVRFHNPDYASSNMVASLLCAQDWFDQDLLVSYADIVCEPRVAAAAMASPYAAAVAADEDWRGYWTLRYGSPEADLETFAVDHAGRVTDLGRPARSSAGIALRYIGLVRFTREALQALAALWQRKQASGEPWSQSGKPFAQGYLTDALHELGLAGVPVGAAVVRGGWLELDTAEDYALAQRLHSRGELDHLVRLGADA